MNKTVQGAGLFLFFITAIGLILNHYIAGLDLPENAAWTGLYTLEKKIDILERYVRGGPVDAVVLGNSVTAFGVSAEQLSAEMSRRNGEPYRVFNMSAPGAHYSTQLNIYKIFRSFTRVRELFVFSPMVAKKNPRGGPTVNQVMERAPVARVLAFGSLIRMHRTLWQWPITKNAHRIRDWFLFRSRRVVPGSMRLIAESFNSHGDVVLFGTGVNHNKARMSRRFRKILERYAWVNDPDIDLEAAAARQWKTLLPLRQRKSLAELVGLAREDGARVRLLVIQPLPPRLASNTRLYQGRLAITRQIAATMGVDILDLSSHMHPRPYERHDGAHLNAHGAKRSSNVLADLLEGVEPVVDAAREYASESFVERIHDGSNPFSSSVFAPDEPGRTRLQARFTGMPGRLLTTAQSVFSLTLPDGTVVERTAVEKAPLCFEADFGGLDLYGYKVVFFRFLRKKNPRNRAIPLHMLDYRWIAPAGG